MSLITTSLNNHHHQTSTTMPLSRLFSRSSRHNGDGDPNSTSSPASTSPHSSGSIKSRMSWSKHSTTTTTGSNTPAVTNPTVHERLNSPHPEPAYVSPLTNPSPPTRRPGGISLTSNTPAEPPPAYTPPIAETADDPYAFLTNFDTVFLIDDSGSMAGRSWRETGTALATVAPVCAARDRDGIDLHFLNHPQSFTNITSASMVQEAFQSVRPGGGTPTGTRLHTLLKPYLAKVQEQARLAGIAVREGTPMPAEVKPLNIIVITDGVPSDDVESVIMQAARKLEACDAPAWQVGIQFFQVGREPGAAEALQELDDELVGENCPRDIVDTVPWNGASSGMELSADKILKCVLGAVVKKLDRRSNSPEQRRRR